MQLNKSSDIDVDQSLLDIAIIGMSCNFPGANTTEKFWENLVNGISSIQKFTKEELQAEGISDELLNNPNYVPAKGIIDQINCFDANFFDYNPHDAKITDPQQRLFLESAWEALEKAGYTSEKYPGIIGVYASMADSSYLQNNLLKNSESLQDLDWFQARIATSLATLSTQISYRLNLTGPSINVATACSSSLVAIATACKSLIDYECDIAISGAVSISSPHKAGYLYQEDGIESPDGICRTFDANANGTVFSDGLGIIILKRLQDAIQDNDTIHAVIKGWNINNDGSNKPGYTAPSVIGQATCAASAISFSSINPESISYLEAHGTGTTLGDVIELNALTKAFNTKTEKKQYCAIGSVKTNIGHSDIAAGMASVIKTVMALKNKVIPATLNYHSPNPKIDFNDTPFYVNTEQKEWEQCPLPRRAGVNASGIGGTNAFLILEEFNQPKKNSYVSPNQLFILSAKTKTALNKITQNLIHDIQKINTVDQLADIAFTYQIGRKDFNHRRIFISKDIQDALHVLKNQPNNRIIDQSCTTSMYPKIVFMFSGQGTQYLGMAKELYQAEPEFAKWVNICINLNPLAKEAIEKFILNPSLQEEQSNHTLPVQLSLFVLEYSLAKLFISLGIEPDAMIGHSLGEYVAACLANVMSLQDALMLVSARAQLMATSSPGLMLAVELEESKLLPFLKQEDDISIAAINSPTRCVLSGKEETILKLQRQFDSTNVSNRILRTSHAFHSKMMDPILKEFLAVFNKINLKTPEIPLISNLTGTWVTNEEITNPEYWKNHLRHSVKFLAGLQTLLESHHNLYIEIGPGQTLSSFARELVKKNSKISVLNSLPTFNDSLSDHESFLNTVGQLWLNGCKINWQELHKHEVRHRVPLSTYPFERNVYWINADNSNSNIMTNKKLPYSKWLYEVSWERSSLIPKMLEEKNFTNQYAWVLFLDNEGVGETIYHLLLDHKQVVIAVKDAQSYAQLNTYEFTINSAKKEDYLNLTKKITEITELPLKVLNLFPLTKEHNAESFDLTEIKKMVTLSFYSLLFFTQALIEEQHDKEVDILAIGNELFSVLGHENIYPAKATVIGPCRVIPQEHASYKIRVLDLVFSEIISKGNREAICKQIILESLKEQQPENNENIFAYRNQFRWIQVFRSLQFKTNADINLKPQGVYLFTGGLGGISLTIAKYICDNSKNPRLALISRSTFPPQKDWHNWLSQHGKDNPISKRILKLKEMLQLGAKIVILDADISNFEECKKIIDAVHNQFGALNGVVHAAGIAGGGLVQFKTSEMANKVFAPKIEGTYILSHLLQNTVLDFFLMCSSASSVIGEASQVDYCSANACLDAFTTTKIFKKVDLCAAINWNTWREVGMALETERPLDISSFDRNNDISPQEGAIIFKDTLANKLKQAIVSTYDIYSYIHSANKGMPTDTSLSLTDRQNILGVDENYAPPTNEIEIALVEIWQNVLGIDRIGVHDSFSALGGHSLMALRLLNLIEKKFNVKIGLKKLLDGKTIYELAKAINTQTSNAKELSSMIVPIRSEGTKPPLFCFHPVGGTIFCYLNLAENLKIDCPIYGLQDPGIEQGRPLFHSLEEMASSYLQAIQKIQKRGPYLLCGLSFGATLAVEVARQLHQMKETVSKLIFFDGWAKFSDEQLIEEKFIQTVLQRTTATNIDPTFAKLSWQKMNMLLNYKIPSISDDIILFKAKTLLSEYQSIDQSFNYWDHYTKNNIQVFTISGDHETILDEPNVVEITNKLYDILTQIEVMDSVA
jgi:acyl transferase domain-containing protein/thioesterase domain-containing protein/acyl carrier protein